MAVFGSKEELYARLDRTVALLQRDEVLKQRTAKTDVSVGFSVPQLGAEYALAFRKGEVLGTPGKASDTTIGVTLDAATLDGLLSGKIDGESAYMNGTIRLRGDEWTAQSIASYMGYIAKAYNAVIQ